MSEATVPIDAKLTEPIKKKATISTASRVLRYTVVRLFVLFLTVVIAVYLTILIANMGGYVDRIQRGQIQEAVSMQLALNPAFKGLSAEERQYQMDTMIANQEKRLGLDKPFQWLEDGEECHPGAPSAHIALIWYRRCHPFCICCSHRTFSFPEIW
jgi:hypothetical protein